MSFRPTLAAAQEEEEQQEQKNQAKPSRPDEPATAARIPTHYDASRLGHYHQWHKDECCSFHHREDAGVCDFRSVFASDS